MQWGPIVYSVSSTSVNELSVYQAQHILGVNYSRLDLILQEPIKLDDGAEIPKLIAMADQMRSARNPNYESARKFVKQHFTQSNSSSG